MDADVLAEMKHYIGFEGADAQRIRQLAPVVEPSLNAVVDRFYHEILQHPGSARVVEGPEQVKRLRTTLLDWLKTLFGGRYDAAYFRKRAQIGHVHVRVGLPQQYMFLAMEVIWQELNRAARQDAQPGIEDNLLSLHKLLTLETAVMLDSYRQSYSDHIRVGERVAVQERLTQAEHLAQIGQLAASLAHEIKNPLAGISGAIQVIREGIAADHPHRTILNEVLRQINRLDGTVRDLLIYARPKPPRIGPCDLDRVVSRIMTVFRREPELQRVQLEYVNRGPMPTIRADENQIEQLLMNLLLNAAHASPDRGLVRLVISAAPQGVQIRVEDHGQGMDAELCRRAFEPFFTTKAKGTGLGLPICRRIVETHGGTIILHSSPRSGTTATVELPHRPPRIAPGDTDDGDSSSDR